MPIITARHLRLKLVQLLNFTLIASLFPNYSLAIQSTNAENRKIEVKEFKNIKVFTYNKQILVLRKNSTAIAYMNSVSNTYHYYNTQKPKDYQISAYGKNGLHSVTRQKKDLVNYSFTSKNIHFFCSDLTTDAVNRLFALDFVDRTQSDELMSAIDSKQCSEEQQEILKKLFYKTNQKLTSCLDSSIENNALLQDSGYEKSIQSMALSLESFVTSASESKAPLNITCENNSKMNNKLGLLNETTKPPNIAINFEKLDDDIKKITEKLESDPDKQSDFSKGLLTTNQLSRVLSHELVHYYQKADYQALVNSICQLRDCTVDDLLKNSTSCKNKDYSKYCNLPEASKKLTETDNLCINESFTNEISNYCFSQNKAEKPKNSSDILMSCIKDGIKSDAKMESSEAGINKDKGSTNGDLKALQDKHEKTVANTAKVNASLNTGSNKVTDSDFKTVSSETYATLQGPSSNNPNPVYGKAYEVSANSNYGKAAIEAMSAFQKTETNIVPKLNAAVAATTQTVQAASSTLATTTGSLSSSRSPASNSAITTEKIATTSSATTAKTTAAQTATANPSNQPSELLTSTASAAASAKASASGNTNSAAAGKIADSSNGSGISAMAGGSALANTSASSNGGASAAGSISQGAESNAGASRSPASLPAPANNFNKSVQALKAFSSVSGTQYQEVRSNYQNPDFDAELEKQDIRILVKSDKGQYLVLGSRNQKTQRVFLDDEKQKSIKILNDNRR